MENNESSKVFVTQEVRAGKIDYAPAHRFGDLKFITLMDFSSEEESIGNKVLVDEIRSRTKDFDAERDFIVITGSPLVAAAVFMVLRERFFSIRVLRWSNISRTYSVVTINLQ